MRYSILVALTALSIGLLLQVPQLRHMMDAHYRGIPVQLNSDEDVYLAHLQEALSGRPEQSSEAIVGDPQILGSHAGILERIEGALFRPFGFRAATVEQIMDSIVPPVIFLALILFFSLCGFSRRASFFGACAFVLIELYTLNRPVQPRGSFLLLILAFAAIIAGLERRWWLGCIGGLLLGLLFGVYFWAWTFGWLWLGFLFLCTLIEWYRSRAREAPAFAPSHFVLRTSRDESELRMGRLRKIGLLCLFGLITVIAAVPSLLELRTLAEHPLYADAVFRSGMHAGRLPESWPYSILFAVMALGTAWAWWRTSGRARTVYPAVTVLTAFIAIHQQVLHGVTFNFVSHYLFVLVVAAICVVMMWSTNRRIPLACGAVAASVYLAAIAYDGRHIINQWTVRAGRFDQQHFATLLPILDDLPRTTILSDPVTELFLASSTKHDVVYTLYLKNVLMSHEEIADRFCATQIPVPAADRHLELQQPIYPDADSAFSGDPSVPAREQEMIRKACDEADRDPRSVLKRFGVQYVLWDEQRQPTWNLKRLRVPLTKAASGSGWSLVRPPPADYSG